MRGYRRMPGVANTIHRLIKDYQDFLGNRATLFWKNGPQRKEPLCGLHAPRIWWKQHAGSVFYQHAQPHEKEHSKTYGRSRPRTGILI